MVIGILIALGINNWNEQRKNRIAEIKLYETIIKSLESDFDDVEVHLQRIDSALVSQEAFITYSAEEILIMYPNQKINEMLRSVKSTSSSFFPNYKLYEKISNNNEIDLIQSSKVKEELRELYEQHYVNYHDLDLNIEHQAVFSLINNYFSKTAKSEINNKGISNSDFLVNYHLLTNECSKIYNLTIWTRDAMETCKSEIADLLTLLQKELDILK